MEILGHSWPLTCPITLARLVTPVRGQYCKHRRCFDAESFRQLSFEKRQKCILCGKEIGSLVRCQDTEVPAYIYFVINFGSELRSWLLASTAN